METGGSSETLVPTLRCVPTARILLFIAVSAPNVNVHETGQCCD
jgi:hypothetical protein